MSNQRTRCRAICPMTPRGALGTDVGISEGRLRPDRPERLVIRRAHPLSSDLGVHEEPLRIKGLVPFEHEVDSSADLVGEDAERFAVADFGS